MLILSGGSEGGCCTGSFCVSEWDVDALVGGVNGCFSNLQQKQLSLSARRGWRDGRVELATFFQLIPTTCQVICSEEVFQLLAVDSFSCSDLFGRFVPGCFICLRCEVNHGLLLLHKVWVWTHTSSQKNGCWKWRFQQTHLWPKLQQRCSLCRPVTSVFHFLTIQTAGFKCFHFCL